MLDFAVGFACGTFTCAALKRNFNSKERKLERERKKTEEVDLKARALVTFYQGNVFQYLDEMPISLTGYYRDDEMFQRIVVRIPEIMREMEIEKKL